MDQLRDETLLRVPGSVIVLTKRSSLANVSTALYTQRNPTPLGGQPVIFIVFSFYKEFLGGTDTLEIEIILIEHIIDMERDMIRSRQTKPIYW